MKKSVLLGLALLAAAPAFAAKDCEELKTELTAKIESHGAKRFSLEIAPKDQATDKRVVGTCAGGSKKIIYTRQ